MKNSIHISLLVMLVASIASAQNRPPPDQKSIGLSGIWKDGADEVTITQIGKQVSGFYTKEKKCDYRDGSGTIIPWQAKFDVTLDGKKLTGTGNACYWGKGNKMGVGIRVDKVELTVNPDGKTLDGTQLGFNGELKEPFTLTRKELSPVAKKPQPKKPGNCENKPGDKKGVFSVSKSGIELIKGHEAPGGIPVLKYYNDRVGYCTTGWGHLVHGKSACTRAEHNKPISLKQAEQDLASDLSRFASEINDKVEVSLIQSQYDALLDFLFNVGEGNFRGSTLLRELNCGEVGDIAKQLLRWKFAHDNDGNTVTVPGLVKRRGVEGALFIQEPLYGYGETG